jgi:hypothetical protein
MKTRTVVGFGLAPALAAVRKCFLLLLAGVAGANAARGAEAISLAGEWRFEIARTNPAGSTVELPGTIHLPGTMDEAGLGPKNTAPPTLDGLYRIYDYAGPACYQRDIEIPAAWRGKRVTLFLERVRWVTQVWLDGKFMGMQDSLIAPHVYDFGVGVPPGKHRLTICMDNTVKLNLGGFVSTLFGGTQGNLNGIIGRIELAATPPVWIADAQVYPDVDRKIAKVKVRIGNASGQAGRGILSVGAKSIEATWDERGGRAEVEVDMSGAKLWDEFAPNLSELTVKLGGDERVVRFGMRKFVARGTQFALNDRPVFLRGTLECAVFPLTGYPPTDTPGWQRIYRIMKSYGLNFIRFHSWCPPEAAFAAADIEGIMIQAEGPMANVDAGENPGRDAFIEAEFKRMVDTYGNHPSFCTMTLGNEYGGKDELLSRWVDMLIKRDPRHLYSSASDGQTTGNRQWTETSSGRGIGGPDTKRDLGDVVASDARPIVGHEIGFWMFFPNFAEMKKYTGVLAPKNFELVREGLEKKHLLDLAPKFVAASGRFAVLLYKEEIEVLLRTPGYAGFSLLDLHDYPNQGTALVGPLDPFWDSKGFVTPAAWRRFCGPTVPLLRMAKRTYWIDEPFQATLDLAHYGPADLAEARPVWRISDEQNREVAAGTLPALNAPTGRLSALGNINASLARAHAPCKLKVSVALQGTEFANEWEIWVYPAAAPPEPPDGVVSCEKWDQAKTALAAGRKVVFFAFSANTAESMRGHFLPVFWSPVWFPSQRPNTMGILCDAKQPLLARFPTESHSNWQWYELMQHSRLFILDDTPAAQRPLVQVIDNFARNHKLGLVFEGRAGGGQLLVCGLDLPHMAKDPAAREMLASLYAYAVSPAFNPAQALDADLLERLFVPKYSSKLHELGADIRADNEQGDYPAANLMDGQPETLWSTSWDEHAPNFPHHLIVQLPQPAKLASITCLPRQDGNQNGWIREYAVYISADGKNWGQPIARGMFKRNADLQTVKFSEPVETRHLKFVALSGFDSSKPYASMAELDVILAGSGQ